MRRISRDTWWLLTFLSYAATLAVIALVVSRMTHIGGGDVPSWLTLITTTAALAFSSWIVWRQRKDAEAKDRRSEKRRGEVQARTVSWWCVAADSHPPPGEEITTYQSWGLEEHLFEELDNIREEDGDATFIPGALVIRNSGEQPVFNVRAVAWNGHRWRYLGTIAPGTYWMPFRHVGYTGSAFERVYERIDSGRLFAYVEFVDGLQQCWRMERGGALSLAPTGTQPAELPTV